MSRLKSPQQIKIPKGQENFLIQSSSSKQSKLNSKRSENKGEESVRKIIELERANNRKNQQSSKINKQQQIEKKEQSSQIIKNKQTPQKKALLYQYQMLRKVPTQISVDYKAASQKNRVKLDSVETIVLFTNYLIQFSDLAFQKLTYLKVLDLSQNLISQIPAKSINENLVNLQTLKLNSNHIQSLPYIKHVRYLQMTNNPLQKITIKLVSMNLEMLSIDWLQYLQIYQSSIFSSSISESELYQQNSSKRSSIKSVNNHSQVNSVQMLKYEYLKKLNQKYDHNHQYYDFKTLFQLKVENIHSICFQEVIAELLYKAIEKQHTFFIDYLNKYFPNLHYNKMNTYNKFLLEEALQIKNSQFYRLVIGLFMPKKWPYDTQFPFLDNIFLSIAYQSVNFFTYLIELPKANDILLKNKSKIFDFLLVQYKETAESSFIATILCQKIFMNKVENKQNQTIKLNLSKYSLTKSRSIMSFWNFIIRNQKLNKLITLASRTSFYENSILHFAIKSPFVQETLDLMINGENKYQIFQKNSLGQSARSQFSGNRIFKKVLWKLQQEFFKIYQKDKRQNPFKINSQKNQTDTVKNFNTPFIKLSQFRNKGLKEILRLLGVQCPQIKQILQNCKNNEFTQKQQQMGFILYQIIERFPLIQSQLYFQNKKLSNYEFQIIIFKMLQTQIFDKRSYLAGQIGRILLHKQSQKSKILQKNQTSKIRQNNNVNQFQINYSDDQLLAQYQLFHSIPFLKTQNFMVSSSLLQNQSYKASPEIGIFDISRFGCKKCQ